jgi:beta-glucosidase
MRAHAHLYRYLKSRGDQPVSSALALHVYEPLRAFDPIDDMLCRHMDFINNAYFLHAIRTGEFVYPDQDAVEIPELKGAIDFWAINHYVRHIVDGRNKDLSADPFPHKRMQLIGKRFYYEEMYPGGLRGGLQRLTDKSVIITAHGAPCDDDRFRIVHLVTYLRAIREAMDLGVDVRGYLYWSTMDNFEWGSSLPKFGLVSVDRDTFERTPKPSARFHKEFIETGRIDQDLIRRHLTELPTTR